MTAKWTVVLLVSCALGIAQPAAISELDLIKQKAESGDSSAQMILAQRYDSGKGVEPSSEEAFKWWLKAAEQNAATAQHNVGVAYLSGLGVARNKEEALKWFNKAANQGHSLARKYADRLQKGQDAAPLVVVKGARHARPPATHHSRYGPKEDICAKVVADFVATHTYIPNHFVCVEFAAGVWWELCRRGINAKVRVGSRELGSTYRADHAWVMAEVLPGFWLAIEPQRGIIYPEPNSFYYRGYDFTSDSEVRRHNRLLKELWEARQKYADAVKVRNDYAARYRDGIGATSAAVLPSLMQQQYYVDQGLATVNRLEGELAALLQKATPSR